MTTTAPPAQLADSLPLEAARQCLERHLARQAATAGTRPPRVATLGTTNLLSGAQSLGNRPQTRATIHLTAQAVLIGPWGAGPQAAAACGLCLAMRWQRLRSRTEREALETGGAPTAVNINWPPLSDHLMDSVWSLYQLTAGADTTRPTQHPSSAHGTGDIHLPRVSRIDLETLQIDTVPLLAEPLCPHCAPPGVPSPQPPLVLAARAKPALDRYRLRPPESYELPVAALANPVCGVLGTGTWADITSPTTAPVAGSVFVRGSAGLNDVTWSGQANSFGTSRALAFLEGLERYAGVHRRHPTGLLVDSYENLAPGALDPRDCGLYPAQTYRDDPMLSPFDPRTPIPWVQGHSLRDDRPILVPARLCHYGAGTAADNFIFACSNGCATGSCLEEAILFGLLELIERDAFLLGWYGNAQLIEIDLASCASPAVRSMTARAALQGYAVHAFDNRVDLRVPVVTALAVRRDNGPGTLAFAAGAGFDPEAAVESALCEILTYLPHLPRQVNERPDELAAMAEDYTLVRRLPDHAALFGLPQMARHAESYLNPVAVRPLSALYNGWQQARPRSHNLLDDLLFCRDELVQAGFDVIAIDQSTPEQRQLGLRTVCTLVPGLLPIDFGWSRQRALHMPRLHTALRRGGLLPRGRGQELRWVPHPFP
ncbi:ribosomal protein S12 methylthiotransferase accessory factor [Kitasatospora sp. GAS204A]|uniref:TOMM precursor leader peptide-binding protein n=1 Tax=unclassified Kitasatospora TaxID=2633591 RepID=UPI0024752499|nr:TOMM precursor leader peptide-binding protein [Kitasatospora sp. GAS204B]MDH6119759.1 ribosomal protein S12 methylthiotransferase accessory factor [Kitasatospora sp. GAS204B]